MFADFYLPDQKVVVEFDGQQHFVQTGFFGSLEEIKLRDRSKERVLEDDGIRVIHIRDLKKLTADILYTFLLKESE